MRISWKHNVKSCLMQMTLQSPLFNYHIHVSVSLSFLVVINYHYCLDYFLDLKSIFVVNLEVGTGSQHRPFIRGLSFEANVKFDSILILLKVMIKQSEKSNSPHVHWVLNHIRFDNSKISPSWTQRNLNWVYLYIE